jgi:hypothetical protein
VRSGLLPFVQHGDRDVAEPPCDLRRVCEELTEADCTREPRRAGADDQDADLDAFVDRIGRRCNEVASNGGGQSAGFVMSPCAA